MYIYFKKQNLRIVRAGYPALCHSYANTNTAEVALATSELSFKIGNFANSGFSHSLLYSPPARATASHTVHAHSQNKASFGCSYKLSSKLQIPIKMKPKRKRSGEILWFF